MSWYDLSAVSLGSWLAEVSGLFRSVLSAALSVPIFSFFAAVLVLLITVGFFAALIRQRGLNR